MSKDVFDFNHISPDLTIEQELELKAIMKSAILNVFSVKKPSSIIRRSNMDLDLLV